MKGLQKRVISESILAGAIASMLLAVLYFVLLSWVAGDWRHPWQQFLDVKVWMTLLVVGFGVQGSLFWYIRTASKNRHARRIAAANSGVSTATMVACCAHHIVDIAPILGASALSIILAEYQTHFLVLGAIFNIAGIVYMYRTVRKHKLYQLRISHV